jgi:hypothetical protein
MLITSILLNPSYPPFSKGRIDSPLWKRGARGDFKIKKVYLKIPRCLCSGEFSLNSIIPASMKGYEG